MLNLTAEQAFVLSVGRSLARGGDPSIQLPAEVRVEHLLSEARRQKLRGCIALLLMESDALSTAQREEVGHLISSMRACKEHYLYRAQELQRELTNAGVSVLARKGLIYDQMLYGGNGIRGLGDLDFFVQPRDSGVAMSILRGLGYEECGSRATAILRRLCPDHLPRQVLISAVPDLPSVEVDIALSIGWYGCDFWHFGESLLRKRFSAPNLEPRTQLFTLTPEEHFLDCCLHLYREGYFQVEENLANDVGPYPWVLHIRQFVDIASLWRTLGGDGKVAVKAAIGAGGELRSAVTWAAFHTDAVLSTDLLSQLDLKIDTAEAYSWRRNTGRVAAWTGDMIGRVFSDHPEALFTE